MSSKVNKRRLSSMFCVDFDVVWSKQTACRLLFRFVSETMTVPLFYFIFVMPFINLENNKA